MNFLIPIRCTLPPCNGKFIDDNEIKTFLYDSEQLELHMKAHSEGHKPGKSFEYWLYEKLKELNIINKYMTWHEFDFGGSVYHAFVRYESPNKQVYYDWYNHEMRNTCRNSPCIQCNIDRINKELAHRIMKAEFRKKGFKTTKSGAKIPL